MDARHHTGTIGGTGMTESGPARPSVRRLIEEPGRLRTDPTLHWIALVSCCVVGLVLASVHWLGLVAGGALVGLVARSLARAIVSAIGFGVLVLIIWALSLAVAGSLGNVVGMGLFAGIGVGIAIALPVLGSLIRGVF